MAFARIEVKRAHHRCRRLGKLEQYGSHLIEQSGDDAVVHLVREGEVPYCTSACSGVGKHSSTSPGNPSLTSLGCSVQGRFAGHQKLKRVRLNGAFPEVHECHAGHVRVCRPRTLALEPRQNPIPPTSQRHAELLRGRAPVVVHRCPNCVDGANAQRYREVVDAPGHSRILSIEILQLPGLPGWIGENQADRGRKHHLANLREGVPRVWSFALDNVSIIS
jgi:hypothetical protein